MRLRPFASTLLAAAFCFSCSHPGGSPPDPPPPPPDSLAAVQVPDAPGGAARSNLPATDVDGLSYRAIAQVLGQSPRRLESVVTVTNAADHSMRLEYGDPARSSRLRAYRSPSRSGDPAWDSFRWRGFGDAMARETVLAPGGTHRWALTVPLHEFLGDSLPDGHYYFTAAAFFNGSTTGELDAGSALIREEPDPLPQSRSVAGVSVSAETMRSPTSQQMLRFVLTITNRRVEPVVLSRDPMPCRVTLEGYGSARRRDMWYHPGVKPDWNAGCVLKIGATELAPGETRSYEVQVPLPTSGSEGAPRPPLYFAAFVTLSGGDSLAMAEMVAAGQSGPIGQ